MNKHITTTIFASSLALTFAFTILSLSGCEEKDDADTVATTAANTTTQAISDIIETPTATDELFRSETLLDATVAAGQSFKNSIQELLANPTEENFKHAKDNWILCHNSFQAFSPYFAISQSNPGLFSSLEKFDSSLEARPIQPGFLDYFAEYTHSGIVNDIALPLTAENLRHQHGITDSSDVVLGFHGIEYLLWGEEGTRPLSDFITSTELSKTQKDEGLRVIDLPNNRRRTLLQLQTDLLVDDLSTLSDFWKDTQGNFQQTYFSLPLKSRNQLIKSAAILRLQNEMDALQQLIDTTESDTVNDSALHSHNQFADKNIGNIVQPLEAIKLSFLEEAAPFQPRSSFTKEDNQKLSEKIDGLTEKLNKKINEWPIETKLAKEAQTLLTEVVAYLQPDIKKDEKQGLP